MKRAAWVVFATVLTLPIVVPVARAGDFAADVNFVIGMKQLDDDWDPVDTQPSVGVETMWGRNGWPVLVAADLNYSTDGETIDGVDFDGTTAELALGVRRSFRVGRYGNFRPYVGGGAVAIAAEVEASGFGEGASDDDVGVGFWIGGGLAWRLGRRLNLGVATRYTDADVRLARVDGNAGGLQLGFLVGWTLTPDDPISASRR